MAEIAPENNTARERFLRTLDFKPADPPFASTSGLWLETEAVWRQQGWDGRPLNEIFGLDEYMEVDVFYGPVPRFTHQVIEEDERTRLVLNGDGILQREFKQFYNSSMPQFIKYPVATEEDFAILASERLALNRALRFPAQWQQRVGQSASSPLPRRCFAARWGGFFGPLRDLMGLEGLCMAFYDQPQFVERMMEQRADALIAITAELLRHTQFEVFAFWEDMACNHGPLIDPKMFRQFAFPHYRRVCDSLHQHGIKHIWLDSDGDSRPLIPIWLDAGINGIWPNEVRAGMDVVALRRQYGHALRFGGGINKLAVAQGGEAMRREVDRVIPVVEDGGYIPDLDHNVPPDISWSNYSAYVNYLLARMGRG